VKIKTIIHKLSEALHKEFSTFCKLTDELQELKKENASTKAIDKHYSKMIKIAVEIEPALPLLSFSSPQLENVLLQCISIHNHNTDPEEVCYDDNYEMFHQLSINQKELQ